MKEFFNNKRNIIISVVSLVLVVAIVIVAVTFNNNKIDVDNSTTTTQGTTENNAQGNGTITEEVTEESSETSDKTQEEDETKDNTETSTKKPETTTKKPNKTETTTKKPITTTKPSKPETTTKPGEKVTLNAADLSQSDLLSIWREVGCETEAEYKAYLKNVPNYKCVYCGDHNCPSIEYCKNRLGDTVVGIIDESKCPAIKAEKIKCSLCGKTLVDISDERWRTEPNKYCNGYCDFNFG